MEYTVVSSDGGNGTEDDVKVLIERVNNLIKVGWVPVGGITSCCISDDFFLRFFQAMTRTK